MIPTIAVNKGRFCKGTAIATTTKLPVNIPAPPSPATALPAIRAGEVGASAHTRDPNSKRAMAERYVIFTEKKEYIFPKMG